MLKCEEFQRISRASGGISRMVKMVPGRDLGLHGHSRMVSVGFKSFSEGVKELYERSGLFQAFQKCREVSSALPQIQEISRVL